MATTYVPENFQGRGICYLNGVDLGNIEDLKINLAVSTVKVKNYRKKGGGEVYSKEIFESGELTATLLDWSLDNLKLAARATSTDIVSSAMNITKTVTSQSLIEFDGIGEVSSVTVDGQPGVEGEDYTVSHAGVYALVPGIFVITGTNVAQTSLQALVNEDIEYRMLVALENEMGLGKRIVKMYRVKFSPASTLALISNDAAKIELKGTILADESKPEGKSQYFEVFSTK